MPRVVPPIEGRASDVDISPSLVESIAGFTAGVVATLAVHPFDVLKTRLQLNQATRLEFGSSWRILRSIVQNEGNYRGLYRGLMPNMIGNSTSWGLYFFWYVSTSDLKDAFRKYRGGDRKLSSAEYFAASGTSGVLTAICTNPIWVIKTRMLSSGRDAPGAYRGVLHGTVQIMRNEGILGFYRGLIPSLFGVSHGAIQFVAYEQLKNHRRAQKPGAHLSNWDFLTLSALSKMLAGSVTYPYQVVRSRLQTYEATQHYRSASDLVFQIWRKEGVRGFYKGLAPNIIRVLPSTCVTFLVYENTKFYLPQFYAANF
ncbi:mitochondrial carrier [Eremomyces bilateralis CBS 781.70]|uniref:Mitochondrial carrier n=1 Tax=Eremomyces bilateralis CBS 781.70 TaxID=1392243 RepID=A0A6G1G6Q6_9PEZI|nr:mitochondrial carrier [Eremomyces bilateralis CBS 781.70]KAF1813519.1 mitochondrial carrier [Eremomyces bilateralis CBS 781.70]